MSKLNIIQQQILGLSEGAFQKLCDEFLAKEGYENINSLGSVHGADKTRKGTPDSWIPLPNGNYIFVEHTTKMSGRGLFNKLLADIKGCLNEVKAKVPITKIETIILCFSSNLEAHEYETLIAYCQQHDVSLRTYGMSRLSLRLHNKYPKLVLDYLQVEIDTHQVLDLASFVQGYDGSNRLTTPLATEFLAREEELEKGLQALESGDLLIISGQAGVGKSRLALEICNRFAEKQPHYEVKGILNRGRDLHHDLHTYLHGKGHYLLLVDDANRLTNFDAILHYRQISSSDSVIKIVATVRDYALNKVQDAMRHFGVTFLLSIERLNNDMIAQLLDSEHSIKNGHYIDRINDVSKGNPRLALMMGKVAATENTLASINDASNIYDAYFHSVQQQIDELNNRLMLQVVGIITFFRSIDRTDTDFVTQLLAVFQINELDFWQAVENLHRLEIVDLYEKEIVKISDQILGTYLFYRAFFKDKALDFSLLLKYFFPSHHYQLVDVLNPVLSIFNNELIERIIRPTVKQQFRHQQEQGNHDYLLAFSQVFWFVIPTETLLYLQGLVEATPFDKAEGMKLVFESRNLRDAPAILKVIQAFRYATPEQMMIAVEILLDFTEQQATVLPHTMRLLKEHFGFELRSYAFRYIKQHHIIELLWKRANHGKNYLPSQIFIIVCQQYLITRHSTVQSYDGQTVVWRDFELNPSDALLELRSSIWSKLIALWQEKEMREHLWKMLYEVHFSAFNADLLTNDAASLLPFFQSNLAPTHLRHCILVQKFLDSLDNAEITFSTKIREQFNSAEYQTYNLLYENRLERRKMSLDFEAFKKYRYQLLANSLAGCSLSDCKQFLNHCITVAEVEANATRDFYRVAGGFSQWFTILSEQHASLFCAVFDHYLTLNTPLNLPPLAFIRKSIQLRGIVRTENAIRTTQFDNKSRWLLAFYEALPNEAKTKQRASQIRELFQELSTLELSPRLDFLLGYLPVSPNIGVHIVRIILEKAELESQANHLLERLV